MAVALLSFFPLALGLFLLTFGVPDRPLLAPSPRNVLAVAGVALLLGPVAQLALGFVGWIAAIGLLVAGVVVISGLRAPRRPALHE